MSITYDFIYELMRAYKDSNLLINKRVVGGQVEEFLDISNSYKQIVINENREMKKYQYIEIKILSRYRSERSLEKFFKRIETEIFQNKLLEISDEEIQYFNTYWNLNFIGLVSKLEDKNSAGIYKPDGNAIYVSLEKGKELPDVFEILFKPLAFIGG